MQNIITNYKNKYIFYNDNRKVLCFDECSRKVMLDLTFPKESSLNNITIYDRIINLLKNDNKVFLYEGIREYPRNISVNNKLVSGISRVSTQYYSCYKNFTKEELDEIKRLSDEEKIRPYLFSIDELLDVIPYKGLHYNIENSEALKVLKKKLDYEVY
ncbi:MAG: hypothetical protein IJ565_05095 [Bacilli bacterium]|nr:hypothetical protein [Bacilli bacterium]